MFVFRRNDSETFSPSNIRMMSRFWNAVCFLPPFEYGRCLTESSSTIEYLENRVSAAPTVVKNASSAPSGRSSFVSDAASACPAFRLEEVEKIPAQNAVDRRVLMFQAGLQIFGKRRRVFGPRITVEIAE